MNATTVRTLTLSLIALTAPRTTFSTVEEAISAQALETAASTNLAEIAVLKTQQSADMPSQNEQKVSAQAAPVTLEQHQQAVFNAIKKRAYSVPEKTLSALPSLEFTNEDGETPLLYSASTKHGILVRSLLKNKAYTEAYHPNGSGTPLLIAVKRKSSSCVSTLLNHHAHIEATDSEGKTALMIATELATDYEKDSNLNILCSLISHHASNAARDKDGNNALLIAVKNNNWAAADALLNRPKRQCKFDLKGQCARTHINATNNDGDCALGIAIRNGNAEMVKLLVIAGARHMASSPSDPTGKTSLFATATPELQLIIRDAVLEQMLETEQTRILKNQYRLRQGIRTGDLNLIDAALADDADIKYAEKPGYNHCPLIDAMSSNAYIQRQVIEELLKRKADIDQMNSLDGLTPLMYALQNSKFVAAYTLLDNNADVRLQSHTSALHIAVDKKLTDTVKRLLAMKAPVDARAYPISTSYVRSITGPDVPRHQSLGLTPLQKAITQHNHELIKILIMAGADPEMPFGLVCSPMDLAKKEDAKLVVAAEPSSPTLVEVIQAAVEQREQIKRKKTVAAILARDVLAYHTHKQKEKASLVDEASLFALRASPDKMADRPEDREEKDPETIIVEPALDNDENEKQATEDSITHSENRAKAESWLLVD